MTSVGEYLAEIPADGNTLVDGKFWLVVCTDAIEREGPHFSKTLTRTYKAIHELLADAEREAVRLATKYPGYRFAVVESMAIVEFDKRRGRAVWEEAVEPPNRRLPVGKSAP